LVNACISGTIICCGCEQAKVPNCPATKPCGFP
jgi:hypothetical protein